MALISKATLIEYDFVAERVRIENAFAGVDRAALLEAVDGMEGGDWDGLRGRALARNPGPRDYLCDLLTRLVRLAVQVASEGAK